MPVSEDVYTVFSAEVELRDGEPVLSVPRRELETGSLEAGETYRVAVLAQPETGTTPEGGSSAGRASGSSDSGSRGSASGPSSSGRSSSGRSSSGPSSSGRSSGHSSSGHSGGTGGTSAQPPVEEGETLDVEVEDLGDKGDGIARIGPGYVVFIPDTDVGDRVTVEITQARENFAFAEVVTEEPVSG